MMMQKLPDPNFVFVVVMVSILAQGVDSTTEVRNNPRQTTTRTAGTVTISYPTSLPDGANVTIDHQGKVECPLRCEEDCQCVVTVLDTETQRCHLYYEQPADANANDPGRRYIMGRFEQPDRIDISHYYDEENNHGGGDKLRLEDDVCEKQRVAAISLRRTVVFMQYQTTEDFFFKGGIDYYQRSGCNTGSYDTDPCHISISVNDIISGANLDKYNAWRVGCTKLYWHGQGSGQGPFEGAWAHGTPAVLTSNLTSSLYFHPLNRYGENYWMTDITMNCSQTWNGWFELKGFTTSTGYSPSVPQVPTCSGSGGGSKPTAYFNGNRFARCGYINVFTWDGEGCTINHF